MTTQRASILAQIWASVLLFVAIGINLASWLPRERLPFPLWYAVLGFVVLVLLEMLLQAVRTRRFWLFPRTFLDLPMAIIVLQIAVSLYATYDLAQSLPKVYGLTSSILVFYTLQRWVQLGRWQWWLALAGYGAVGVVVAVLGGAAANVLPTRVDVHLPNILELNANELAGVLLWFAPLSIGCACAALSALPKKWWLVVPLPLLLSASVITTGVLLFTRSRAAVIGLAVALLLGWVLVAMRRAWWVRLLMLTLLVVSAVSVVWLLQNPPNWLPARLNILTKQGNTTSIGGREELWSRGLYALEDFPITGMGMNTFRKLVHIIYPLFTYAPTSDVSHAHNQLIQIGVDLGLPALIATLAMLILLHLALWRSWRQLPIAGEFVALGFAMAIWGHLVYGIFDAVAYGAKPGVFWWALLALITQAQTALIQD